jgi:hypothetical protein
VRPNGNARSLANVTSQRDYFHRASLNFRNVPAEQLPDFFMGFMLGIHTLTLNDLSDRPPLGVGPRCDCNPPNLPRKPRNCPVQRRFGPLAGWTLPFENLP